MLKSRFFIYFVILALCMSSISCAALQRKFIRKKKKEEQKITPIITTYDYSKELRVDELYKKHFLFWKSWQSELIIRIDGTHKKREACYNNVITSLLEMKKYLTGTKVEELDNFITKIKSIEQDIRKDRLSESEKYRIGRLLEGTKRQIDKEFSYSNVKDFLVRIDKKE